MFSKIKKSIKDSFPNVYASYRDYKQKRKQERDFKRDFQEFRKIAESANKRFDDKFEFYPEMEDKTKDTPFESHYTYHPAWAARILAQTRPDKHVDISSILHFSTLISAFVPIDFYDYRPAKVILPGLKSEHADLTALPFASGSVPSISCMHTIEHIGLGRYGDPLDYDGDLKAIKELKRVLAPNGNLLMVVPIGKPKIAYNAHRIYAYDQVVSYFAPLDLVEFSLLPDDFIDVGLIKNASKEIADQQYWGCGCFWFKNPGK
ncbi:MAG: DUF268 domain-containing protein [Sphingobacteriaceae bacterium]|nr:DUF268 domain-containing protein [Sphingobacteriaceae bacterium]